MRLRGLLIGAALWLVSSALPAAQLPVVVPPVGDRSTLVVYALPTDQALSDYAWWPLDTPAFAASAPFYEHESYGRTRLYWAMAGWVRATASAAQMCEWGAAWSATLDGLHAAGYTDLQISGYAHILAVVALPTACAGSGVAAGTFGHTTVIFGSFNEWATTHELGHQFGLQHAGLWICDPACRVSEFGDPDTVMGAPAVANGFERVRLGWATPMDVTRDGTYPLAFLDGSQVAAPAVSDAILRVPTTTQGPIPLWFFTPAPYTFRHVEIDTLSYRGYVSVRGAANNDDNPFATKWRSFLAATLTAGQSVTLGGITVTVVTLGATGAVVSIAGLPEAFPLPQPASNLRVQ